MVNVTMKYLQERASKKRGSLSYRYRRPVPGPLKAHLGKGEIVVSLGATLAAATRAYGKVDGDVERALADAWDVLNGKTKPQAEKTARELFDAALERARNLGVNPYRSDDEDSDDETRELLADGIASKYLHEHRAAGGAYDTGVGRPDEHHSFDTPEQLDQPTGIEQRTRGHRRLPLVPVQRWYSSCPSQSARTVVPQFPHHRRPSTGTGSTA